MALRMRQSIAELERQFVEEAWEERVRRDHLRRQAAVRSRQRHVARQRKQSSLRFFALVLLLVATAALVTFAMFETLYLVLS